VGVILGAALLLSGCATPPTGDPAAMEAFRQANDELEPMNRTLFDVNMSLDKAVLKPIAYVYKEGVPAEGQEAIGNFLANLRTPVILLNDLLQGEWTRAGDTIVRFAANSTFGLGGLLDVATHMGVPAHDEDFGQTLAVWGVEEGPYLMLPLFGPSNPRDAVGRVVDILTDPIGWFAPDPATYARFGTTATHTRAKHYDELNDLEKNSLDFYAALRSLYRQKRADEIRNGVPSATPFGPSPLGAGGSMELDDQKAEQRSELTIEPLPPEPPAPLAVLAPAALPDRTLAAYDDEDPFVSGPGTENY
jgi:phospholipid-binding lipoprotein MlaA